MHAGIFIASLGQIAPARPSHLLIKHIRPHAQCLNLRARHLLEPPLRASIDQTRQLALDGNKSLLIVYELSREIST